MTYITDKFGVQLPRYLYHYPNHRGFNKDGGIDKYTWKPTDAYEGVTDLEDMVMLSRDPNYTSTNGVAKIDVSKLPAYKKKLINLGMTEGHFSYKGDIPAEALEVISKNSEEVLNIEREAFTYSKIDGVAIKLLNEFCK